MLTEPRKAAPRSFRVAQNANANLKAEEADNINLGAVWTATDNLQVTLDYWAVDYTNLITIESAQGKVVADPSQSDIKRTEGGTLFGITTNYFNAASVNADGIDIEVAYDFPESSLGDLGLTVDPKSLLEL